MSERLIHHEKIVAAGGSPVRWLVSLHGVFGTGRNWAQVVREVVGRRPEWGGVIVDLREHGRSVGMEGPATLGACAEDVLRLGSALGLSFEAVLGHSFGGKVALTLAAMRPAGLTAAWIIDSTLESLDEPAGDGWKMMQILRALPDHFASREELVATLLDRNVKEGVANWMAANVERRDDGRYHWRFDRQRIEALLRDYYAADLWHVIDAPPPGLDVHIVKAGDSYHIGESAVARIERAAAATRRVHLHQVTGGHWLNVDNPQGVIDLLVGHLP